MILMKQDTQMLSRKTNNEQIFRRGKQLLHSETRYRHIFHHSKHIQHVCHSCCFQCFIVEMGKPCSHMCFHHFQRFPLLFVIISVSTERSCGPAYFGRSSVLKGHPQTFSFAAWLRKANTHTQMLLVKPQLWCLFSGPIREHLWVFLRNIIILTANTVCKVQNSIM